jgi:hypothetical protein
MGVRGYESGEVIDPAAVEEALDSRWWKQRLGRTYPQPEAKVINAAVREWLAWQKESREVTSRLDDWGVDVLSVDAPGRYRIIKEEP